MTSFVHRSLAAAALGATLCAAAPGFAAGPGPCDMKIGCHAATDEYCVDRADVHGPGAGSPLPVVQCRPKIDWLADRLAIARD